MESRANTYGLRLCLRRPERAAMKQKPENCVRRLMGEGRETLRDGANND